MRSLKVGTGGCTLPDPWHSIERGWLCCPSWRRFSGSSSALVWSVTIRWPSSSRLVGSLILGQFSEPDLGKPAFRGGLCEIRVGHHFRRVLVLVVDLALSEGGAAPAARAARPVHAKAKETATAAYFHCLFMAQSSYELGVPGFGRRQVGDGSCLPPQAGHALALYIVMRYSLSTAPRAGRRTTCGARADSITSECDIFPWASGYSMASRQLEKENAVMKIKSPLRFSLLGMALVALGIAPAFAQSQPRDRKTENSRQSQTGVCLRGWQSDSRRQPDDRSDRRQPQRRRRQLRVHSPNEKCGHHGREDDGHGRRPPGFRRQSERSLRRYRIQRPPARGGSAQRHDAGVFRGHVDEFDNNWIWHQWLLVKPGNYQVTATEKGNTIWSGPGHGEGRRASDRRSES